MQLPWEMMRWHNWYMEASAKAVLYVNAKIPADMQEQLGGAPLVMVDFRDMWNLYRQERLDAQLITVWTL